MPAASRPGSRFTPRPAWGAASSSITVMGAVVGETASIGDGCIIYKGVVLGARTRARVKRHPDLEEGVIVGSNACILGDIRVGAQARVGSGRASWSTRSLPPSPRRGSRRDRSRRPRTASVAPVRISRLDRARVRVAPEGQLDVKTAELIEPLLRDGSRCGRRRIGA